MSSDYDFILDNLFFSYSSVTTFEQCEYSFKLMYIDAVDREGNFWSQFGLLWHSVLQGYFEGKIEKEELLDYYNKNYDNVITFDVPRMIKDKDSYRQSGIDYFSNFNFDLDLYDVLVVEGYYKGRFENFNMTIKPDVVLREKSTGKVILVDFKTAAKIDKRKISGYMKQFYLYVYFLERFANIKCDYIDVWLVFNGDVKRFAVDEKEMEKTISWLREVLNNIYKEDNWKPKINPFWCLNICSCSKDCKFKPDHY